LSLGRVNEVASFKIENKSWRGMPTAHLDDKESSICGLGRCEHIAVRDQRTHEHGDKSYCSQPSRYVLHDADHHAYLARRS
jgi:hypothetical protein